MITVLRELATAHRRLVFLAADFADSGEWIPDGFATAAHWIADTADVEVSTAREWIRVGRSLRSLKAIADAFANGLVSYSKVRALTRIATVDNEAELLDLARRTPAGNLRRAIAAWVGRNSSPEELAKHQQDQRSCTWQTEPDGMTVFTVRLPPLAAGVLIARLEKSALTKAAGGQEPDISPEEAEVKDTRRWPTLPQQYADAITQMAAASPASNGARGDADLEGIGAGGAEVEVVLHVRGDGCTLDDGTPIPLPVVESVAPKAFIRALIHDALGRPINASSRHRHPTTRQKRVVRERDRACVDCGGTALLHYDHVPDYAITHRTVVDELELRCSPCHNRRHQRRAAS